MTCRDHDADLLAWVHGDLEGGRAWCLRAHLALCPSCRARAQQYASLSRTLARVYRNPTVGVRAFPTLPRRAWLPLGALVIVLSVLGWLAASDVSAATAPQVPTTLHGCPRKALDKSNFPSIHCDR